MSDSALDQFKLLTQLEPSSHPHTVFAYILASELYSEDLTQGLNRSEPIGTLISLGSYASQEEAMDKVTECMSVVKGVHIFYMSDNQPFPVYLYPESSSTFSLSEDGWKRIGRDVLATYNRNKNNLEEVSTYNTRASSEDSDYFKTNFYYLTLNAKMRYFYRQKLEQMEKAVKERAQNCYTYIQSHPQIKIWSQLEKEYENDLVPTGDNQRFQELKNYLNNLDESNIPRVISDNIENKSKEEPRSSEISTKPSKPPQEIQTNTVPKPPNKWLPPPMPSSQSKVFVAPSPWNPAGTK